MGSALGKYYVMLLRRVSISIKEMANHFPKRVTGRSNTFGLKKC